VNTRKRPFYRSFAFWSLAALIFGLGLGIWGYLSGSSVIEGFGRLVQPVGALWLRSLQLIVVPLVVLQLLTVLTGGGEGEGLGRTGARTVVAIAAGSLAVMVLSLALAAPVVSVYEVAPGTAETIRDAVAPEALGGEMTTGSMTAAEWFTNLVPTNLFQAFVDGNIIQILLLTVLFGLACSRLPDELREVLGSVFRAMLDAVMVIIRWVLVVTPVGVFALMLGLSLATGVSAAGVVVAFLFMNQGIPLAIVLILYPVAAILGGTSIWDFARAVAPVQLVAVSTRSSLSTMPVQIESGRDRLQFSPRTTGVLVPLCVTLFKITSLVSDPVRFLFLAHVFGMSLTPGQVIAFLASIFLINFAAVGIPRGHMPFNQMPAYAAAGIPLEGYIILHATSDLEDYPDTVANATGMFAAATALSRGDRRGPKG